MHAEQQSLLHKRHESIVILPNRLLEPGEPLLLLLRLVHLRNTLLDFQRDVLAVINNGDDGGFGTLGHRGCGCCCRRRGGGLGLLRRRAVADADALG